MKFIRIFFFFILIGSFSQKAYAWGFWAHQRINRLAVFTLPPDMLRLYKQNIQFITEHAVDPDKRRYAVEGEAPRHYIDVDHYGEYPFDNVPRQWKQAEKKFSQDTLMAYGIVPWHIHRDYFRLVDAFRNKDAYRIVKISSDLGHYIADSNVPLHTTENYNGQMTGQKGIHGLWESRLPELFGIDYDFFVGKAQYVDDIIEKNWETVLASHIALDSVLGFEKELTNRIASDKKYSFENRGSTLQKVYSLEFCRRYHEMLSGMVERRMRASIVHVGSIWYTAWVDAGQPDLRELVPEATEEEDEKFEKKIRIIDREGSGVGMIHDHGTGRMPCEREHLDPAGLSSMYIVQAAWNKWGKKGC